MTVRIGVRFFARLLAVAALALGVVAMHHVAGVEHGTGAVAGHGAVVEAPPPTAHAAHGYTVVGESPGAPPAGQAGDSAPPSDHSLLHLCLAVLTVVLLAVVGWLVLVRRMPALSWPAAVALSRRCLSWPPPRSHGVTLLRSLCVMRT